MIILLRDRYDNTYKYRARELIDFFEGRLDTWSMSRTFRNVNVTQRSLISKTAFLFNFDSYVLKVLLVGLTCLASFGRC